MLGRRHYCQIVRAVIKHYSVDMVNYLRLFKLSTKLLFGHDMMFVEHLPVLLKHAVAIANSAHAMLINRDKGWVSIFGEPNVMLIAKAFRNGFVRAPLKGTRTSVIALHDGSMGISIPADSGVVHPTKFAVFGWFSAVFDGANGRIHRAILANMTIYVKENSL